MLLLSHNKIHIWAQSVWVWTTKPRLKTYRERIASTWRKSNQNIIIITTLFIASAGMFSFHVLIRCYIVCFVVVCVLSLGFGRLFQFNLAAPCQKLRLYFNFSCTTRFTVYHILLLVSFIVAGWDAKRVFDLLYNSFKRDSPSEGINAMAYHSKC